MTIHPPAVVSLTGTKKQMPPRTSPVMATPLPTPLMPLGRDSPTIPQMTAGRPSMKADTQLMKGIATRQTSDRQPSVSVGPYR
jgi:hypothetical protein